MIDLKNISIKKAHEALKNKEYSVRELVDAYLKNIEEKNKDLNVYLSVFSDSIDEEVKAAQERYDNGTATEMTGIPMAIKANINIKGKNTSAGSKILENYISPYDATVIEKLKAESVVFLGYANMDEFACGGSTENSAYGVTKNPLDVSRVPGGPFHLPAEDGSHPAPGALSRDYSSWARPVMGTNRTPMTRWRS